MSRTRLLRDERLTAWSIWSLLLATVMAEVLGQTQLVSLGFYTLHIVDPPVVIAFIACGFCLAKRRPSGGVVIWSGLIVAGLIIINFLRGMVTDPAMALLWARANLATAALLLLVSVCPVTGNVERAFRSALITSGGILAALTLLRLVFGPALFMLNPVADADMINDGGRALQATGAFVLGLSATLLLSDVIRTRGFRALGKLSLLVIYIVMEIASGQGSASAALAAMLTVVFMIEHGVLRGTRAVLGGIGTVILLGVLVIGANRIFQSQGGVFDLAHRSGNLETRETIWAALKVGFAQESLFNQLFGLQGGQLPEMMVFLSGHLFEWQLAAHSMYYGSLPLMGYVGLSTYIFLLVSIGAASLQTALRRRSSASPAYPMAMCAGTAILSYTYEIRLGSMAGLFVALWWFRAARMRFSAVAYSNAKNVSVPSTPPQPLGQSVLPSPRL